MRTHVVVSFILIPSGFLFLGGRGDCGQTVLELLRSILFFSVLQFLLPSHFGFGLNEAFLPLLFEFFFFSSVLSSNAMYTDFPYVFFFWFLWFFFFFISFVKPTRKSSLCGCNKSFSSLLCSFFFYFVLITLEL